jgi:hypothetical protein
MNVESNRKSIAKLTFEASFENATSAVETSKSKTIIFIATDCGKS